jgi:hypothetical protein
LIVSRTVCLGQGIGPLGGLSLRKMKMFAFSILFALKGYKAQKGITWEQPTWVKPKEADGGEFFLDDITRDEEESSSEDTPDEK